MRLPAPRRCCCSAAPAAAASTAAPACATLADDDEDDDNDDADAAPMGPGATTPLLADTARAAAASARVPAVLALEPTLSPAVLMPLPDVLLLLLVLLLAPLLDTRPPARPVAPPPTDVTPAAAINAAAGTAGPARDSGLRSASSCPPLAADGATPPAEALAAPSAPPVPLLPVAGKLLVPLPATAAATVAVLQERRVPTPALNDADAADDDDAANRAPLAAAEPARSNGGMSATAAPAAAGFDRDRAVSSGPSAVSSTAASSSMIRTAAAASAFDTAPGLVLMPCKTCKPAHRSAQGEPAAQGCRCCGIADWHHAPSAWPLQARL